MAGANYLGRLSRQELKQVVSALSQRCGESAIADVVAQVTRDTAFVRKRPGGGGTEPGAEGALSNKKPRGGGCVQPDGPCRAIAHNGLASSMHTDAASSGGRQGDRGCDPSAGAGEGGRGAAAQPGAANADASAQPTKKSKEKKQRDFDMGYFAQRHILLHVAYFGEKYRGLADTPTAPETVERQLFRALEKARLIKDRGSANYSRCGRTDAGVSAYSQVLSLTVRSNLQAAEPGESFLAPLKEKPGRSTADTELDYTKILNKLLPDDIFVLGWAPAPSLEYKARFNAEKRTYHYFFLPKQLDLEAMREASKHMVGCHDFRNFCKMDVDNVKHFRREILDISIEPIGAELYAFKITGNAFLWNQVRCIVAVLFSVGEGREDPAVVRDMLDITKVPRKPVYLKASETPLILFDCEYSDRDFEFTYDSATLSSVLEKLWYRYAKLAILAGMTKEVMQSVERLVKPEDRIELLRDFPVSRGNPKKYQRLLERPTCDSYAERLSNMSEKRRERVKDRHGWEL